MCLIQRIGFVLLPVHQWYKVNVFFLLTVSMYLTNHSEPYKALQRAHPCTTAAAFKQRTSNIKLSLFLSFCLFLLWLASCLFFLKSRPNFSSPVTAQWWPAAGRETSFNMISDFLPPSWTWKQGRLIVCAMLAWLWRAHCAMNAAM